MKQYLKIYGITICTFLIAFAIALQTLQPIKPPEEDRIITLHDVQAQPEPSYAMMLSHLKELSKDTHPIGSKEIEGTKAYLIEQLQQMGYTPEVEEFVVTEEKSLKRATPEGMPVPEQIIAHNILVRVENPDIHTGTLVVTHYDSTKHGPGAGDDLVAVASVLESMRVLQTQNQALENNMYFLFTSGEETGLNGATAFIAQHPEMKQQATYIINVEARGNQGTPVLFETSDNNYGMVKLYRQIVKHPLAFSLATEIYKRMPNSTDMARFLEADYQNAINFATVEGGNHYHTEEDNFENLNRGTAAHYLSFIGDLVDHFAHNKIEIDESAENAVFFPLVKDQLVVMKTSTAIILGGFISLIALIVVIGKCMKDKIKIKDLGIGLGAIFGLLLTGAGVGFLLSKIIPTLLSVEPDTTSYLRWDGAYPLYWGALVSALILLILLYHFIQQKMKVSTIKYSLTLLLAILTIVVSVMLPAMSYLFFIPTLCLSVLLFLQDKSENYWLHQITSIITICFTLFVWVPVIYLVFVTLTIPALFICTLLMGLIVTIAWSTITPAELTKTL